MARNTKLREMWQRGWTGDGIDVALIDSGVAPVPGLDVQVINGPDLVRLAGFQSCQVDTYGHGTHMAGLIAGRDAWIPPGKEDEEYDHGFVGAAPGARIVSIKVASSDGATDVSQVIAAIDWVVQHRNSDGLNIRVLNLSFGTDGTQDYRLDPLAYAAEVAWLHGIVVVVAAGNSGFGTPQLNNPAYDPYVIAVGGDDTKGTDDEGRRDPVVADAGNAIRHPDLVAPGKSIISLRDPGAFVDDANPSARRDEPLLQGQRLVAGGRHRVRGRGDAPGPASRAHARSGEGAADADRRAAPQRGSRRAGCRPDQHAPREGGEGLDRRRRRADVAAINRARLAAARPRLGRRRGRGRDPRGRTDDLRRHLGCSDLDGEQLGRDDLVQGRVECQDLVRGLLVRLELERENLVARTWSGNSWSARTWSRRTWSGRTWSGSGWSAGSWESDDAPSALSSGAWASTLWGD